MQRMNITGRANFFQLSFGASSGYLVRAMIEGTNETSDSVVKN